MTLLVALFGLIVAALGVAGVVSPARLLDVVGRAQTTFGLYAIAGLRLVLGGALLLAAPGSRAPLFLTVLGWFALVSGVLTPVVGLRGFRAVLDWWRARPDWGVRLWALLVIAFGTSLVWAVFPVAYAG